MSEEEKEAIEYWKRHIELLHYNTQFASEHYATILLNYIDKLQKENKELKEDKAVLSKEILTDKAKIVLLKQENEELIKENHKHIDYIASMKKKHEDKIRTKIKELEEEYNNCKRGDDTFKKAKLLYQKAILEELLGDDE